MRSASQTTPDRPDSPVAPRKKLDLLLASIISFVTAICAAILSDVLDHTIRDPEQAARALDTSVLGTLPLVKEMRRLVSPVTYNPAAAPNSGTALMKHESERGTETGEVMHPGSGMKELRRMRKPYEPYVTPFFCRTSTAMLSHCSSQAPHPLKANQLLSSTWRSRTPNKASERWSLMRIFAGPVSTKS